MPDDTTQPARRLGLIGFGRIALPIVDCWSDGGLLGWTVGGVLARSARQRGSVHSTDDADDFFGRPFDLIIEAAGFRAGHRLRNMWSLMLAPTGSWVSFAW